MTDHSVAADPAWGSVEARVQQFRDTPGGLSMIVAKAFGHVQGVIEDEYYDDAEMVRLVRNIVAAVDQIRAELRAAAALTPDTGFEYSREQGPEDGVLTHQVPPTDPDDLPADPVGRAVSMARAWGAATPEDAARLLRAWDHRPKLTDAEIASVLDVLFPS